jgi:class 3 adenylate cyclase
VDDNADVLVSLADRLARDYEIFTATDGLAALGAAREHRPDRILLDVMMPKLDGLQVCRELKVDPDLPFIPIVLLTARAQSTDVVEGLDAGADEYLTKPVDPDALLARVRSMLRIKELHDKVQAQAAQLEELNRRLQGFLAPQVAELIASPEGGRLEMHRAEVTVLFCDLRGYTAFAELTQPEHMIRFLREYHGLLGPIIAQHGGTLERFIGDGAMVFFNDPVPLPNAAAHAVRMALAMRDGMRELIERWQHERNVRLGFGVGIDSDYAWLGRIGYEGRSDYAAVGKVTNCAARLCGEAAHGQVLVSQPVYAAVETLVEAELVGDLELKGFHQPIRIYNVVGLKPVRPG